MITSIENFQLVTKSDAKFHGLTTYFTGKPCKHGHVSPRYVASGMCKECSRISSNKRYSAEGGIIRHKNKIRYSDNKEHILERNKIWRNSNKDKLKKTKVLKHTKTPEIRRSRDKKYYNSNKDAIQIKQLNYRNLHREELRQYACEWRRNNPIYSKIKSMERKFHIKQATPSWVNKSKLYEIYKNRLDISNETGIVHHVDHIYPVRGEFVCGLHVPENLQIISAAENMKKSNKYTP